MLQQPGDVKLRWCISGLNKAERRFRKVSGYKQLQKLDTALQTVFTIKGLVFDS
jgi:hypothetical protein